MNNELSDKYLLHCIDCIRRFYPEKKILIIDDNSNYDFVSKIELYNTTVIQSEYPKRGELLPYYYYLNNKLFDVVVIIHNSVFINSHIDFSVDKYKILWCFNHDWDQIDDESVMINVFNDLEVKKFHENKEL